MSYLLGEYECLLDSKSRILLPVALKRQIPSEAQDKFIICRGFERCLTVYPLNVWNKLTENLINLNFFEPDDRNFVRSFQRGAIEISLDSASRLLLPKQLLNYAGIEKDIVLFAYADRFEVWDKQTYYHLFTDEPPEAFSERAKKVMGKKDKQQQ